MNIEEAKYWDDRYKAQDTPWDIGHASPQLIEFCRDRISDKSASILIPGGGRAYEMSALKDLGFEHVYLCDWSDMAIREAKKVNPGVDGQYFLLENFFEIERDFDIILEQTFFCALPPEQRTDYAEKAHELLRVRSGMLAGLFFDVCFDHPGPPFGGSREEYHNLFSQYFNIESFEWADKSIEPRKGTERFMIAHIVT